MRKKLRKDIDFAQRNFLETIDLDSVELGDFYIVMI